MQAAESGDRLPQDVWALILQHVPQADRLKHCALVCKKLSKAAAAATVALEVSLPHGLGEEWQQGQQRAQALDHYLQHHGSHVASLVLDSGGRPLTRLPCPKLLHLDISHGEPVQLGPHGGLPGVLGSCATGLTSLQLSQCTVTPDGGGLSRLSMLVDLRGLQMQSVWQPGVGYATLPGSVLPSLSHLTCLELSQIGGVEDVQHVSSLTSLSVLHIRGLQGPHLLRLARDIAPDFALPASLQQLCLGKGIVLDLDVFAAATQLASVELEELSVEGSGGGVSSGAALLAAVAGLQQLDTLVLRELEDMDWPKPSAAYTALTASSKLQKLVVHEPWLSEGVWEHVFSPARCCPAMRVFAVYQLAGVYVCSWGAEAASSLVRCCPGLQQLQVSVASSPPVAALQLLSALTGLDLCMRSQQADVAASVAAIAALTTLRSLRLELRTTGPASVGRAVLLPLTALRGLTSIGVSNPSFEAKADPKQPLEVWQQLQQWCLAGSSG